MRVAVIALFLACASDLRAQSDLIVKRLALRPALAQVAGADSMYFTGRRALNRNDYGSAIAAFTVVGDRYPLALVAPNAWYWRAYAHYRAGMEANDTLQLHSSLDAIGMHMTLYEDAFTEIDVVELLHRVRAALASRGSGASVAAMIGSRATASEIIDCKATMPDEHARALASLTSMSVDQAVRVFGDLMFGQGLCHDATGAAELYSHLTTREQREVVIAGLGRSLHPSATRLLLDIARKETDQHAKDLAVTWLQVRGDPAVNEAIRQMRAARSAK